MAEFEGNNSDSDYYDEDNQQSSKTIKPSAKKDEAKLDVGHDFAEADDDDDEDFHGNDQNDDWDNYVVEEVGDDHDAMEALKKADQNAAEYADKQNIVATWKCNTCKQEDNNTAICAGCSRPNPALLENDDTNTNNNQNQQQHQQSANAQISSTLTNTESTQSINAKMEVKVDDNDNKDNNEPQSQSAKVTHTTTSIISIINPPSTAHTMDNQNDDDAPPKTQNPFKPIELGLGYNMTTTWDSPQSFRAQQQIERRSQGRVLPKLLVNSMCVAKPPTDDNKANDQKVKTQPDSSIIGAHYICSKCGLINAKYRCKECKLPRVNYCSYKCQAAHWIVHKLVCPFAKNNNRNKNNNPRRHKRRSNQRYMTREADSFMMKQSGSHTRTQSQPILLNDYMDGTRSSEDRNSSGGSSNKSSSSIKRRSASVKRDRKKKKSRAKYKRSRSSSSGKRKLNQNQEITEFYKRGGYDPQYEPPSTKTLDTSYRKKKPKRRRKSKKEENMDIDDEKNQNENRRGRALFKMNEDSVSDGEYSDHHRNRKNENNKNRSKSVPSSDSNKIAQWDYDTAIAEFQRMNPEKPDNSNNKPNTNNNDNKPPHINFLGLIKKKENEMSEAPKKGNGEMGKPPKKGK